MEWAAGRIPGISWECDQECVRGGDWEVGGSRGAHRVWQPREGRASAMGGYRLGALETHERQRERKISCLLAGAVAQRGVGGHRNGPACVL